MLFRRFRSFRFLRQTVLRFFFSEYPVKGGEKVLFFFQENEGPGVYIYKCICGVSSLRVPLFGLFQRNTKRKALFWWGVSILQNGHLYIYIYAQAGWNSRGNQHLSLSQSRKFHAPRMWCKTRYTGQSHHVISLPEWMAQKK